MWVYTELERWHYLSFLKSSDTLQMLRSIESHSDVPEKIAALIHLVEGDLGFNLHQSVQAAKSALSSETWTRFLFGDYSIRVEAEVKRSAFEEWIEGELQKIRSCIDRLLDRSGISISDVDRVFLTGGTSLVPAVRRIVDDRFGSSKISSGSEFTSVAKGLALRALEAEA